MPLTLLFQYIADIDSSELYTIDKFLKDQKTVFPQLSCETLTIRLLKAKDQLMSNVSYRILLFC